MVQIYIFNPVQKLRLLSRLFARGSKRFLTADHVPPPTNTRSAKWRTGAIPHRATLRDPEQSSAPLRDLHYYKEESEGFCVFLVENTLFKIHRCFLLRESSAFGDMFALPSRPGYTTEGSDNNPVPLADTADQFRDFLWALYALPSDLCLYAKSDAGPPVEKLLNIAELANKYCFASYESWAIERIFILAQEPMGLLRQASPQICARIPHMAVLCDHRGLLELVTQRLISRMLWSNIDCHLILEVAQRHGLRKLEGVAYYKELIAMERVSYDGRISTQPIFAQDMDVEKRMRFLSAHHSLVALWEGIRVAPPMFLPDECSSHGDCMIVWTEAWINAGNANHTLRCGSADVLGRLKSMMISLRKTLPEMNGMSVGCTLAALESITTTRDHIIDGLIDHFTGY